MWWLQRITSLQTTPPHDYSSSQTSTTCLICWKWVNVRDEDVGWWCRKFVHVLFLAYVVLVPPFQSWFLLRKRVRLLLDICKFRMLLIKHVTLWSSISHCMFSLSSKLNCTNLTTKYCRPAWEVAKEEMKSWGIQDRITMHCCFQNVFFLQIFVLLFGGFYLGHESWTHFVIIYIYIYIVC